MTHDTGKTTTAATAHAAQADLAALNRVLREIKALAERMLAQAQAAEVGDREAAERTLAQAELLARTCQMLRELRLQGIDQAQRLGASVSGLDT